MMNPVPWLQMTNMISYQGLVRTFLSFLTVSQRRTLFMHAGLTEKEFNQPYWRINEESCYWRDALFRALRELFSLFEYAPTILTSVKPEQYLH